MAEALFRSMSAGLDDVRVFSAGLSAPQGAPASRDAVDVLAAQGIDLSKFRSQPVTEDLLEKASHVFVMTREHERLVDMFFPEYIHKVRLLRFDEQGTPDVPDPIGQGRTVYAECKRSIEQAMPSVLRIINQKPMTTSAESQTGLSALTETDPEIAAAIEKEYKRQFEHIELIASENFTSRAVMEAQGSCLTNKYAEGYPGRRWYGGCEYVDIVETLAIERAKKLFGAQHVNVQPHSGSQANMAVYFSVLTPGDKILTMDLAHGGHLTHGHKANFSGKLYEVHHYGVSRETEIIDYDALARQAEEVRPKMITAGASAYPRIIDFKRMREIAEAVGAYLFVDMAHISGLVAGNRRGCWSIPLRGHGPHLGTRRRRRAPLAIPLCRLCHDDDTQEPARTACRSCDVQRGIRQEDRRPGFPGRARRTAYACHRREGGLFPRGPATRFPQLCPAGRE